MASFSQRKVQRLKDMLMHEATDSELDEIKKFLNQRPKKTQAKCGLLKLPAELRNIIYEYVAEDAHAACQKPVAPDYSQVDRWQVALALSKHATQCKDSTGTKVRPGLLGAGRELFEEFHSVFYSSKFIDARFASLDGSWRQVTNPAMLDSIINRKHQVTTFAGDRVEFGPADLHRAEKGLATYSFKAMLVGMLYMKDAQGRACGMKFKVFVGKPPWSDMPAWGEDRYPIYDGNFNVERSCKEFCDDGFWTLKKREMCSLCIRPSNATEGQPVDLCDSELKRYEFARREAIAHQN